MTEFIEMETTGSSSSQKKSSTTFPSKIEYVEKVVNKEYQLRPFSDRSLSYWWVILPILFYLTVAVGGIMTSISVGNVYAAFDSYCIFNANFTLKDINALKSKNLETLNIEMNYYGSKVDCEFSEYASVGCVIYAGVWIVMVLQCGRGGASRRGFRLPDAWRIVPPTCVGNLVVLVISAVILEKVTTGFKGFCDNILTQPDLSNLTCIEILEFHFPWDKYKTDLVQEYEISHIGSIVQFVGCLLGFFIVALRCCLAPDFDVYERRQIGYFPAETDEPEDDEEEDIYNRSCNSQPFDFGPLTKSTTVECHNPAMLLDSEDHEFLESMNSHSELLISDKNRTKATSSDTR